MKVGISTYKISTFLVELTDSSEDFKQSFSNSVFFPENLVVSEENIISNLRCHGNVEGFYIATDD